MKATARPEPGVKMRLRVYSVNRAGIITEDRGCLDVLPQAGPPQMVSTAFPPCACPRCVAAR
ncbi:hypothetical protein [Streptomyces cellostaticus]|uniref:hypothetical protein n=1 Tax=Streptomyces TaxID=1883 RepID=UPI0020267C16|nr:hypothetical protein [Streptomyces cellostaticus]